MKTGLFGLNRIVQQLKRELCVSQSSRSAHSSPSCRRQPYGDLLCRGRVRT